MLVRNRSLVEPSQTALNMAVILLLWAFGFCAPPMSQAFAETTTGPKKLFISHKLAHFVAVNGSDTGPGTADRPWATINHAADQVEAGDIVVVRGGRYVLHAQVRLSHSGRSDSWITFIGYPGERPIFDAQLIPRSSLVQGGLDNGAFQIERVSYVRVANLTVINSHDAAFTVRDSSNIELINNSTKGTFSSGIAVWDTNHEGKATRHIKILGNTITQATTWDLAPAGMSTRGEPPQEALSIDGAMEFEVAHNYIYDSGKEGIDIKGTSKRGEVHHNLVAGTLRQGIYVDAWFGEIRDIEIFSNVIHRCRGAGLALSVENGVAVENITIHNNLIFDNAGSGLYFSRWGVDHTRRNIQISNNVFYHNGYGPPQSGQTYYWLTGGLYLYSTNVHEILISNNIFSGNRGFQIGYSDLFVKDHKSWQTVAREKAIHITSNLIDGRNTIGFPIEGGGALPDRVKIYAVNGNRPIFGSPMFKNPAKYDFALRPGTSAAVGNVVAGAYAPGTPTNLWWKRGFPPKLLRVRFN
jgi:hypothetical protein